MTVCCMVYCNSNIVETHNNTNYSVVLIVKMHDFIKNANGLVRALQLQFHLSGIHLNCEIDSEHFFFNFYGNIGSSQLLMTMITL